MNNKLKPINGEIVNLNGIYIKLENINPTGSIKFRPALNMINHLLKEKKLKKSDTIIEATSGNMGIALAYICNIYNINCIIVLPEQEDETKIKILKSYNAKLIITPKEKGIKYAVNIANELANNNNEYYYLDQFNNINNPNAYTEVADDIINKMKHIDYFICGMGTSGCLMGIGKRLKEKIPNIKIIGIEPYESAYLTNHEINSHGIQGIGMNQIPSFFDMSIIDQIEVIKTKDVICKTKKMLKSGYDLGISSCANLLVCEKYLKDYPDKIILTIAHDGVIKYLSVLND